MNNGVKLLLDRMDTNPEEFETDGKWLSSFNFYKKYMTDEERTAVTTKLSQIKMAEFEKRMVEQLFREEQKMVGSRPMKAQQVRDIIEHGINQVFDEEYAKWSQRDAVGRITLTPSDVALADKLGVSYADFARRKELLK